MPLLVIIELAKNIRDSKVGYIGYRQMGRLYLEVVEG